MKLIDFDEKYAEFAEKWIRENTAKYKNMDALEAHPPELLLKWLNTPMDWLDGFAPGTYFTQFQNPDELIAWLRAYEADDVSVPDPLLQQITDLGDASIPALMALAADEETSTALRMTALNLMIELDAKEPLALCLDLVMNREAADELADVAAEVLEVRGYEAVPGMLERLSDASEDALLTYLDLLCNFPGDERIYTYTSKQLLLNPDRRALYASYLAKLGDERAIEPLERVIMLSELSYLDYIEIRNAIEALGGDTERFEREFAGDPYYESLKTMG